ncbi:hypothetical protein [Mucisphaera calidilacus]|uniref:Uncharacterized protein n=1 Tax=Mucisphaera calidilacus TaxID=2527982 RepID=A0A518BY90_9BACT|nr:hypothetical protein [Mucisphaera calidilacus]QDU71941.1 hypothetical protein Pan265_18000 [Mucisphaera calidilacus]
MTAATSGAAGAGAAAAVIAQAIKASGAIVHVQPDDFLTLLDLPDEPLVVHATGGVFRKNHQYIASVKGLAFYTKADVPITLPDHILLVESKQIWIP